jgi:hypothetical protein
MELALERLELQHECPLTCDRIYDDTLFSSSDMTVDDIESDAVSIVSRCAIRCGMSSPRQHPNRRGSLSKQVSSKVQHSRLGRAISEGGG